MDELKMDGLELPELPEVPGINTPGVTKPENSGASGAPGGFVPYDLSAGTPAADSAPAFEEMGGGSPSVNTEKNPFTPPDIAPLDTSGGMPVFEEMGGGSPGVNTEKKPFTPPDIAPLDTSGGMPVFEEMGGSVSKESISLDKPAASEPVRKSQYDPVNAVSSPDPSAPVSYEDMFGDDSAKARKAYNETFGGQNKQNPPNSNGSLSYGYGKSASYDRDRENALDMAMRMRQENYEKGYAKAKVLGIVMIVMAAFIAISALANGMSFISGLDLILAALIAFETYRFLKGSNKARKDLGWLALFDLADCSYTVIAYFNLKRRMEVLTQQMGGLYEIFGVEEEEAEELAGSFMDAITTAMTVNAVIAGIGIVIFAVLAYFFLLDSSVSDFTVES